MWWWLVGVSLPRGALCLGAFPCEHHGCRVFSLVQAMTQTAEMPDTSKSCFINAVPVKYASVLVISLA